MPLSLLIRILTEFEGIRSRLNAFKAIRMYSNKRDCRRGAVLGQALGGGRAKTVVAVIQLGEAGGGLDLLGLLELLEMVGLDRFFGGE